MKSWYHQRSPYKINKGIFETEKLWECYRLNEARFRVYLKNGNSDEERKNYGKTSSRKKYIFRQTGIRTICCRCFGRTGKYMEISIPGSEIWRRHFFTDLHYPGTDLRLLYDHGRDCTWTYDPGKVRLELFINSVNPSVCPSEAGSMPLSQF